MPCFAVTYLCKSLKRMVLQERIELSTSPLPRECSTTELLQQRRPAVGRAPENLSLALLPQWMTRRKPAAAVPACAGAKRREGQRGAIQAKD
jgi:hypothetical protein